MRGGLQVRRMATGLEIVEVVTRATFVPDAIIRVAIRRLRHGT